ncbi:hypothetical protein PYW08_003363 [Mythimna loreyi]|uniref:Uncharacterized protein n=1 Tax=Mythimna loreyi TaxID=667449 RepID=A0ACC2QS32_9NEOP|nr:hypothetical protein PYW08_003363 [Mythimna loreyi]
MDKIINNPDYSRAKSIHEFTVRNLKGELIKLESYKGFICVIVNITTNSQLTKQNYKHFNDLMEQHGDKLRILAFPCYQFGDQPLSEEEIAKHAEENDVKFDIFARIEVNGEGANALWKYLKHAHPIGTNKQVNVIKSNFTKYIVNKLGIPVERHGPEVDPLKFDQLVISYF